MIAERGRILDPRRSWPAYLATTGVVLAAFLALLDPAPSRGLGPAARAGFWLLHVLGPLALAQAATIVLTRRIDVGGLRGWAVIAAGGAVAAVLFAPAAALVDLALQEPSGDDLTPAAVASEAAALLVPVTLAWTAINGSRFLRLGDRSAAAEVAVDRGAPAFLGRLRPGLGADIVALSAELHYLRVHTALGDDLILYPFGRAVAEMPEGAGLRVHRSHWIARGHLTRIERSGSAGRAVLGTGLEVPVARSRMAAARAAL